MEPLHPISKEGTFFEKVIPPISQPIGLGHKACWGGPGASDQHGGVQLLDQTTGAHPVLFSTVAHRLPQAGAEGSPPHHSPAAGMKRGLLLNLEVAPAQLMTTNQ